MLANAKRRGRIGLHGQQGVTLAEVLVAMIVMAIISGVIASTFISSIDSTDGLDRENQAASDIGLLSAFFPPDVMSMAGPQFDPNDPSQEVSPDGWMTPAAKGGGICGGGTPSATNGVYTMNSEWDEANARFDKTVTYRAVGVGADSKFTRTECKRSTNFTSTATVVAQHFGRAEENAAANSVVGIRCSATECRLEVNGAFGPGNELGTYDYELKAKRRVRGADPEIGVPCTPVPPFAEPSFQENFVTWEAPVCDGGAPITYYEVRETEDGVPGVITRFSATEFSHTFRPLALLKSYTYAVRATNHVGAVVPADKWSAWSAESLPGIPDYTTPGAPTITSSSPGNQKLTVTWNPPANDGGKIITGYILRATNDVGETVSVEFTSPVTSGVISGLVNGNPDENSLVGAYTLTVSAKNEKGEGKASAPFGPSLATKPLPGVPDAPTNLVASNGIAKGVVHFTWDPPSDDGGTAITGYQISSTFDPTPHATNGFAIHDETGQPTATSITYSVQACNAKGCGAARTVTFTPTWTPEKIVANPVDGANRPHLRGVGIAGQGQLRWNAPDTNGRPITGHQIQCSNNSVTYNFTVGPGTDQTITGLPATNETSCRVKAVNALGAAETWSNQSNGVVLSTAPQPPTITGIERVTQTTARVLLTPPANTGGYPVQYYRVRYLVSNTVNGTYSCPDLLIDPVPANPCEPSSVGDTPYVEFTNLQAGKFYRFQASLTNTQDVSSGRTGVYPAAPGGFSVTAVPNPPTNLVLADPQFANAGQIKATFSAPVQPPGTLTVTGYELSCVTGCPSPRSFTIAPGSVDPVNGVIVPTPLNAGNALPVATPMTFRIRSLASENGPYSDVVGPITLYGRPGAVRSLTATPTGASGTALVSWQAPLSDGGKPITDYQIEIRCTPTSATCARKGDVVNAGTATSQVITGLTNGHTYDLRVSAANERGYGTGTTTTVVPRTVANAPAIGIAEATGTAGQAIVRWTPPADNGGNAIIDYRITASSGQTFTATGPSANQLTVNSLPDGDSVTFTVQARNVEGFGPASAPSNAVITGTVPGQATDLLATATGISGQVELNWTAAPDNGPDLTANTITASCSCAVDGDTWTTTGSAESYLIGGLPDGEGVTFTIVATNFFGDGPASDPSNEAIPLGVPDAPTGVNAARTPVSGTVFVTWTPPADDNGSPVTSYSVTAYDGGGAQVGGPRSTTDTSLLFPGLEDGVPYTFRVQAFNAAGPSALSDPSTAISPWGVPDAPTGVTATATGVAGSVLINWSTPDSNGSAITSYTIEANDGNGADIPNTKVTVGPGNSATVTGFDRATPVAFVVYATNDAGTGPASAQTLSVVPAGLPDAPTDVVLTRDARGSVKVDFTAPADDGGSPVTGYTATITCGAPCTRNGQQQAITNGGSITGLGDGASVSVAVAAVNSSGTGPNSANSPAITTAVAPSNPTGVGAVLTGLAGQVTINWSPPANDGGLPLTEYRVFSVNTSETWVVPAGTTTYTTPRLALPNNANVSFRVFAVNDVGQSTYVGQPQVTTPTTPGAPTGQVYTTPAAGQVGITWNAPASDGRSPITHYEITISAPGKLRNGETVTSATTNVLITGLSSATQYTLRIRAVNDVGGGTLTVATASRVITT